ncbi:unnamed protein product [Moneuplotes crassus]|uniref:BZIP domain-containing protein n=1 Tax=Euplotes crassus TaxID=5936 RepID=A0AAD1XLX5_EUPCR|nr:unnamed protein product [Moneuplotes crassus]
MDFKEKCMEGDGVTKYIRASSNKERSKAFRERKKKFLEDKVKEVESLRKEVETLREENSELKIKLQKLKAYNLRKVEPDINSEAKCGSKSNSNSTTTLQEHEDYLYNTIAKKLQNNPDEVRFSTIEQAHEPVYDWSDERVQFIKKLFKDIIDNLLGLQSKCYHSAIKEFPINKLIKMQKNKKRQKKYFDKAQEPKTPKDLNIQIQLSDKVLEMINNSSKFFNTYIKQTRKIAQTLIIQRNKLLNLYQDYKLSIEKSGYLSWYTKTDFINSFKLVDYLQHTKFVQPHFLYNIPAKTHSNLKYEQGELTE